MKFLLQLALGFLTVFSAIAQDTITYFGSPAMAGARLQVFGNDCRLIAGEGEAAVFEDGENKVWYLDDIDVDQEGFKVGEVVSKNLNTDSITVQVNWWSLSSTDRRVYIGYKLPGSATTTYLNVAHEKFLFDTEGVAYPGTMRRLVERYEELIRLIASGDPRR